MGKVISLVCLFAVGCGGAIAPCDVARTIRLAAETGERFACGSASVEVLPVVSSGGEGSPEAYTVVIEGDE